MASSTAKQPCVYLVEYDDGESSMAIGIWKHLKEAKGVVLRSQELDAENVPESDAEEEEETDEEESDYEYEGDDDEYFDPEYEKRIEMGHYVIIRIKMGKYYGWHDALSK